MGSLASEFSRGSDIALTLLSRLKDIFTRNQRHFLFTLWEMLCIHSNFANTEVSDHYDFANGSEGSLWFRLILPHKNTFEWFTEV